MNFDKLFIFRKNGLCGKKAEEVISLMYACQIHVSTLSFKEEKIFT